METERLTQIQWIEHVQKRYREIQTTYLACTERAMARQLAVEMRLLEAALMGIELGATYGICISCENPISKKRLDILIWTLWCIECAAEQNLQTRSPRELLFPLKLA